MKDDSQIIADDGTSSEEETKRKKGSKKTKNANKIVLGLNDARREGEEWEDYKKRRKLQNQRLKHILKGRVMWNSRLGAYRRGAENE